MRLVPRLPRSRAPPFRREPHPDRDPQLSGRRAFIRYDRDDSNFWFNPVVNDEPRHNSDFPCSRGDIFLKLGMRGARLIPWQLREGDVFRLGQAYVLVSKVRLTSDTEMDLSVFGPDSTESFMSGVNESFNATRDAPNLPQSSAALPGSPEDGDGGGTAAANASATPTAERASAVESAECSDDDEERAGTAADAAAADKPAKGSQHECYICYEAGVPGNPLISPCQCIGSVKYVHLNCLQRWIQPEGSSAVNTHCSICKARYPEKAQAMMIRPPALLLESWSNHRALRLRHWVSFANHSTASLGRFTEHNDVVIPDHSVSGEHALIIHSGDEFWLHDRESSNGTFIRLSAPLKLGFGEVLQMKMGKSLLCLQAKRSRWSRLRQRLNLLRLGGGEGSRVDDDAGRSNGPRTNGADRDCDTSQTRLPAPARTSRPSFGSAGGGSSSAAGGAGSSADAVTL